MVPERRPEARLKRLKSLLLGVGCVLVATLSCGREPTGPGHANWPISGLSWLAQFPDGAPELQTSGSDVVAFTKVRVVLRLPGGVIALDTLVDFPGNAPDLQLTLSVALPASAPDTGQSLSLRLEYQNDAGQTVFTGGPVKVTAVPVKDGSGPPPPSPVTVPLVYTGPGASAKTVVITPPSQQVNMGDSLVFTAQAKDSAGAVIPNTPIVFTVADSTLAAINVATGHGKAANRRGATTVTAKLLTGPSAAATLNVVPVPAAIRKVSGDAQSATVTDSLAAPLVVRVTAADTLPVAGATVNFAVTSGGGTVTASATTDTAGLASAIWRLGDSIGVQGVTASAGTGITAAFTATAGARTPAALKFVAQPPTTVTAGAHFGATVNVVDAKGVVVPTYTGPVSAAVATGGVAGPDTTTVNAVAGVATFTTLAEKVPGAHTLLAFAGGLTGAVSDTVTVTAGAASRVVFTRYPAGGTAGAPLDTVRVTVQDSVGNVASAFGGTVALAIASGPAGATLSGTTSVNAVAGVATFAPLGLDLVGSYTLAAAVASIAPDTGAVFTIGYGTAAAIAADSGDGQAALIGTQLTNAIVGRVVDAFGNGVPGTTVVWSVQTGGGSLTGQTTTTDATGRVRATWTLGTLAGGQSVTLSSGSLSGSPVTFTATASTSIANAVWTGVTSTAWNVASNWSPAVVPTAADSVLIQASGTQPVLSANAAVRRLTIQPGATLDVGAFLLTVGGNLDAGTTILGSGGVLLAGKTGTFAGVVNGSVGVADTSTYTLSGRAQVSGAGGVAIDGTLILGGHTLETTTLTLVGGTGALVMTNAADSAIVHGNAGFDGSNATTLSAGVLAIAGNLSQGTSAHAFGATASHTTVLNGAAAQTVTFANPGSGGSLSHFGTLKIDNVSAGGVALLSNAFADGQLVTTAATTHNVLSSDLLLTTMGANVTHVAFTDTRWTITDGAAIAGLMDSVTFQAMNATTTYFTLQRAGDAVPYPTFTNWTFEPSPSGAGLYMNLQDVAADANALTVSMAGTNPGVNAGLVSLNAGPQLAVLNGWGNALTWVGTTSTNWHDSTNWSPQAAPTALTNVVVPSGTPFAPTLADSGAVHDVAIAPAAVMTVNYPGTGGFALSVGGNLTIGAGGKLDVQGGGGVGGFILVVGNITTDTAGTTGVTSCGAGGLMRVAGSGSPQTVTGKICALDVTAADTAVGPLVVTGSLTLNGAFVPNGHAVSVDGGLTIVNSGGLVMTNPADSVVIAGAAIFNGSGSILTNGKLVLLNSLSQNSSAQAFSATASHTTILAGNTNQVIDFANPGTGASFSHFGTLQVANFAFTGPTFQTNAFVDGQLVTTGAGHSYLFGSNTQLVTKGANVSRLTFNNLRWQVSDGAAISGAMDSVTFQSMLATSTFFSMVRAGDASAYPTFTDWDFQTTPTGAGLYMDLQDVANDAYALTVNMSGTNPLFTNGFVKLNGGPQLAVLNGWGNTVTWVGNSSAGFGNWDDQANWSPPIVPTLSTSVLIPPGYANAPQTGSNGYTVNDLTVGPGAVLTMFGGSSMSVIGNLAIGAGGQVALGAFTSFTANGNVTADTVGVTGVTGCETNGASFFAAGAAKQVTGRFCNLNVSSGSYAAIGPVVVNANLRMPGGTFAPNGHFIEVIDTLSTSGTGGLVMTNAADTVAVVGPAIFAGAGSSLSNGRLRLFGDLYQNTTAAAFSATSPHTTSFEGSGGQHINVANPGNGTSLSHFGTLEITNADSTVGIQVINDLFAEGPLVTSAAGPHLYGAGALLTTQGATVPRVNFHDVRWKIDDGAAITQADSVSFLSMTASGVDFTMARSGGTTPTFKDWVFQTLPTVPGLYMDLQDIANDGNQLTVNMSGTAPGLTGGFVRLNAGAQLAVLNGWDNTATWTGVTSNVWNDKSNWNTGVVPTVTTDVVIPTGTPNVATITTDSVFVRNLTVDPSATMVVQETGNGAFLYAFGDVTVGAGARLDLQSLVGDGVDGVLVYGNLITDTLGTTGVTGCSNGSGVVAAYGPSKQIAGKFCDLYLGSDYSAVGPMVVNGRLYENGNFNVNSNSVSVSNELYITGSLTMAKPADSLTVGGAAYFFGNAPSTLTNGKLVLNGSFQESGSLPNTFAATSGHTTILTGKGTQFVSFLNPGTGGTRSHFGTLRLLNDTTNVADSAWVDGQLIASDGALHVLHSGFTGFLDVNGNPVYAFMVAQGADLANVDFDNFSLKIVDGAAIGTMKDVVYTNPFYAANLLTIARGGTDGPYALTNFDFGVGLDGGYWLVLDDTNRSDGTNLTVNMSGTTPANQGPYVLLVNNVEVVNGWPP